MSDIYINSYYVVDDKYKCRLTVDFLGSLNRGEWEGLTLPSLPEIAQDLEGMFDYKLKCRSLDLSNWNLKNVKRITRMCCNCSKLKLVILDGWNLEIKNPYNIYNVFQGCNKLKTEYLPDWVLDCFYRTEPFISKKKINVKKYISEDNTLMLYSCKPNSKPIKILSKPIEFFPEPINNYKISNYKTPYIYFNTRYDYNIFENNMKNDIYFDIVNSMLKIGLDLNVIFKYLDLPKKSEDIVRKELEQ